MDNENLNIDKQKDNEKSCCKTAEGDKAGAGLLAGLLYGLIPHTGCIAFIVFTVLGATSLAVIFKPLLMNPFFFYGLIALSMAFASVSALMYLKRNGLFSLSGAGRKWKYLSILYMSTISVSLIMLLIVFPYTVNFVSKPAAAATQSAVDLSGALASPVAEKAGLQSVQSYSASSVNQSISNDLQRLTLKVAIPCSGHAPLITEELYKIDGVEKVNFSFPDIFNIEYSKDKTSEQEILSLEIFKTYKAVKVD